MSDREEVLEAGGDSSGSAGRLDILQPRRDLQSNWEVDLDTYLEEYLLKICSGEDASEHSVNFAEAALLLQGSVQVYSRKVEYLYSLVISSLEFLSRKSSQDQHEKDRTTPSATSTSIQEEDDVFLGLDDVPVDVKNIRDDVHNKCEISNHFVKAPTNLLVFEGDCLDSSGEANELESYSLATCIFYGDFLLLDPRDAGGIDSFLQRNASNKEHVSTHKCTTGSPKTHENVFKSSIRRSGGSLRRSLKKGNKFIATDSSKDHPDIEMDGVNVFSEPLTTQLYPEEPHFGNADAQDDSDFDEDPWKPLNPHEPGALKIKPFRKGRNLRKQINSIFKRKNQSSQFPLAKLDGIISPELAESFEVKIHLKETQNASQSPALYEKLRGSLCFESQGAFDFLDGFGSEDQNGGVEDDLPDFGQADYDMGMEVPSFGDKKDTPSKTDRGEPSFLDDLECSQTLEDLCRSHLDDLLAKIAQSEKQSELAARVATWKQRFEQTMEEQEKHPAFDIHLYGERILDKLSSEADDSSAMTFSDVVMGQPKHEVARTFSALLQLVNNGNVDLQRPQSSGELVCHTAKNPFRVKLLRIGRQRVQVNIPSSKKRPASPSKMVNESPSPLKAKLKKGGLIRRTPEGKRRRRSDFR